MVGCLSGVALHRPPPCASLSDGRGPDDTGSCIVMECCASSEFSSSNEFNTSCASLEFKIALPSMPASTDGRVIMASTEGLGVRIMASSTEGPLEGRVIASADDKVRQTGFPMSSASELLCIRKEPDFLPPISCISSCSWTLVKEAEFLGVEIAVFLKGLFLATPLARTDARIPDATDPLDDGAVESRCAAWLAF